MEFLKDRRVIVLGGMALALAAALLVAALASRHGAPADAPPASQGGLVVQTGRDDDIKLDPRRALRCFVNGRFIGELPLSACAQKNGVATGALDVGLDPSGALAAANGVSSDITPLPPRPQGGALAQTPAVAPAEVAMGRAVAPSRAAAACWTYEDGDWTRLPGDMSLSACVQSLYGGQCVRPGVADYGRWGDRTLRLMPGRVEISPDNRNFRLLVEQTPACAIPPLG